MGSLHIIYLDREDFLFALQTDSQDHICSQFTDDPVIPGTFHNWICRLCKRGMVIPCFAATAEPTAELQEAVKVDLIPSHEFMPRRAIHNDDLVHDPIAMPQEYPAVEILLGNSTE